jgi:hypothetical protein
VAQHEGNKPMIGRPTRLCPGLSGAFVDYLTTLPPHGDDHSGPPPAEITARKCVIAGQLANQFAELVLGTFAGPPTRFAG